MKDGIETEDLVLLLIIGALFTSCMVSKCFEGQAQVDRAKHCEETEVPND